MIKKFLQKNKKVTAWLLRQLFSLREFLRIRINTLVILLEDNVHPKHRLMQYHRFFVAHITPADVVLDIGCGKGELSKELSEKAKRVIACDINRSSIDFARKHNAAENIEYIQASIMDTSFIEEVSAKKPTVAVLSSVLEHIEESVAVLARLRRLCQKLLIRVPDLERDWEVLFKKEKGLYYFLDPTHKREYTPSTLTEELGTAGWRIEIIEKKFGELWVVAHATATAP